ncbi:hypothetical protein F0562_006527 [Nyssa sinensis]|uniref:RPW8 domain-containing protein n=1 Tax=Nyssa sinensis TaxID=561372 RepID=A0A5J5APR1_9ASTE|nr:hypothetical protein F0562_006527 [Nyssa sinensis]
MTELILGAAMGLAFDELRKAVQELKDNTDKYETILNRLASTLKDLDPVVRDIEKLNKALKRPEEEIRMFTARLEKGEKLIRKCSETECCSCWKKTNYMEELKDLENSLSTFFQTIVPAQLYRDNMKIIDGMNQVNQKLDEISLHLSNDRARSPSQTSSNDVGKISDVQSQNNAPNDVERTSNIQPRNDAPNDVGRISNVQPQSNAPSDVLRMSNVQPRNNAPNDVGRMSNVQPQNNAPNDVGRKLDDQPQSFKNLELLGWSTPQNSPNDVGRMSNVQPRNSAPNDVGRMSLVQPQNNAPSDVGRMSHVQPRNNAPSDVGRMSHVQPRNNAPTDTQQDDLVVRVPKRRENYIIPLIVSSHQLEFLEELDSLRENDDEEFPGWEVFSCGEEA